MKRGNDKTPLGKQDKVTQKNDFRSSLTQSQIKDLASKPIGDKRAQVSVHNSHVAGAEKVKHEPVNARGLSDNQLRRLAHHRCLDRYSLSTDQKAKNEITEQMDQLQGFSFDTQLECMSADIKEIVASNKFSSNYSPEEQQELKAMAADIEWSQNMMGKPKDPPSKDLALFHKEQLSGTCSNQVIQVMMHNGLSEPLYRKCKADLTTHTIDLFKEIKQPQQGLDRAMLFRRCKKLKPGARANRVGGSLPAPALSHHRTYGTVYGGS